MSISPCPPYRVGSGDKGVIRDSFVWFLLWPFEVGEEATVSDGESISVIEVHKEAEERARRS